MGKLLNRRIFKITDDLSIICDNESTRSGFRHLASILRNGQLVGRDKPVKICYLNRTWESFQFKSVLLKLADVMSYALTDAEREAIYSLKG